MAIELNHTIVPARDKEESARFYQQMFGFTYAGPQGHFAPVRVTSQDLTLDFDTNETFEPGHYAFKVSEPEFDEIFAKIRAAKLTYGSGPFASEDGQINHWNGGRGVYFRDPGGHLLEILTRP
jgi:catechol 2,3-dioxygenase-like lactoylglutathione lyase family enzyme